MANKRMIAKMIVDSDAFLDMPQSTQNLYFHLNMHADDEGFIDNPKKIMRVIGSAQNDLEILLVKRYLLMFESGVIVIKHWKLHNCIRKDRVKPTVYQEEKKQIAEKENGSYTDSKSIPAIELRDCQADVSQVVDKCPHSIDQYSIDQYSIDQYSIDKVSSKPTKHKYGKYKHVSLTDDEYKKLIDKVTDREAMIKKLDEGIELKGYKYKSHYLAILKWSEKDDKKTGGKTYTADDYSAGFEGVV